MKQGNPYICEFDNLCYVVVYSKANITLAIPCCTLYCEGILRKYIIKILYNMYICGYLKIRYILYGNYIKLSGKPIEIDSKNIKMY